MNDFLWDRLSSLLEAWDGSMLLRFAGLANASSLLFCELEDVNWVGFYLTDEFSRSLVVGPFQGNVACIRIPFGRGVCGTAAERKEPVIVPDVRCFPGHIACDTASRSEIVVPLVKDGAVVGVLDCDSASLGRFVKTEKDLLSRCADVVVEKLFS